MSDIDIAQQSNQQESIELARDKIAHHGVKVVPCPTRGLPKRPAAERIDIDEGGEVVGLL